jgi:hypothetical protein
MKMILFFSPENLSAFLSGAVDTLHLSYDCDEKYPGEMQVELDNWKYVVAVNTDFVHVTKKKT